LLPFQFTSSTPDIYRIREYIFHVALMFQRDYKEKKTEIKKKYLNIISGLVSTLFAGCITGLYVHFDLDTRLATLCLENLQYAISRLEK
jgi:hypothetical protein